MEDLGEGLIYLRSPVVVGNDRLVSSKSVELDWFASELTATALSSLSMSFYSIVKWSAEKCSTNRESITRYIGNISVTIVKNAR